MSRRPIAVSLMALLALALAAPLLLGAKKPKEAAAAAEQQPASATASFISTGEVVDCTDYLFMGKKGPDRVDMQTRHIESGMPACFIADVDNDVYLLLAPDGQAREKFTPIQNWLAGDVTIIGVAYQKGSMKAVAIDSIKRMGGYTDRESRRPHNPQPNRKFSNKDPKATQQAPPSLAP